MKLWIICAVVASLSTICAANAQIVGFEDANHNTVGVSTTNPLPTTTTQGAGGTSPWVTGVKSWAVDVQLTTTTTAFSAGQSIGGLLTVPPCTSSVTTNCVPVQGILQTISGTSSSLDTNQIAIYLYWKQPGTPCNDHQAFTPTAADNLYLVGGEPFSVTPLQTLSWVSATYFQYANAAMPFTTYNLSGYLYACVVTGGAFTPASTTGGRAHIDGVY